MYNVIFDMDGVIFDSEKTLLDCWIEISKQYNLDEELVRNTYIQCIGTNRNQSTKIFLNAFHHFLTKEDIKNIWNESAALFRKRYSDGNLPVMPGVTEILQFLKSSGMPAGVASSTCIQTVKRQIRNAGLYNYFVGFVGGDAVAVSKPNPEIYLLACREFGFEPARTFAIEDSFNGIRAASAAGLRPIMIPDMVAPDEEMESLAEFICKNLIDAMEYLKQVC